jgi:hypothetical protein
MKSTVVALRKDDSYVVDNCCNISSSMASWIGLCDWWSVNSHFVGHCVDHSYTKLDSRQENPVTAVRILIQ